MKAIILAGGKGSRFAPITDQIPKALLPVTPEKSLIELVIQRLPDTVDTVIITTKYLAEKIQLHLGDHYNDKKIIYTTQDPTQDGTWSAFYSAKDHVRKDELFCVCNCDDLFNTDELKVILSNPKIGLGATTTELPAKYHGVRTAVGGYLDYLERHTNEDRQEMVHDTFTNGFFLLDGRSFDFPPVVLIDGEYGLPQTILAQKETYPLFVHQMKYWQPCNTFEDLESIKTNKF